MKSCVKLHMFHIFFFIPANVWIRIHVLDYEEATNLLHVINIKRICFSFGHFMNIFQAMLHDSAGT